MPDRQCRRIYRYSTGTFLEVVRGMSARLSPPIELIDTMQFGRPRVGAAYHVYGERHALIETGTSSAYPRIAEALGEIELDYIFVTHVHLDHAGGAGCLARDHPRAKVVVHPRGARHLVDPTRLIESVRTATGDLFSHYGEAIPIPEERVHTAKDGERFDLGQGVVIEAIETPGHAPHHLCFFEHGTRALFTGDAAGVLHKGRPFPATPPPNFDLTQTLESIERLKSYQPISLWYTHFGCVKDAVERLCEYAETVTAWVERIDDQLRDARSPEEVVTTILSDPAVVGGDDDSIWRLEVAMAVRGVLHYLDGKGP